MSYTLDERMRGVFVEYGPKAVMASWNRVLLEFREALKEADPKPTIVLTETLPGKVKEDGLYLPPFASLPPAQPAPIVPDAKELHRQKMAEHKEVVQKKRQEMIASGITPETLLTEEKLKQWIQIENKTYWTIAEETGCSDFDISSKAKSLNILSNVAMMIRKKKAKL